MEKSDSISELAKALSKAQGEMKPAVKDTTNPFFKSKYAPLENLWQAARPALAKHGLSVLLLTENPEDAAGLSLETVILHDSGEWISSKFRLVPTKTDPQGFIALNTYMKRIGLGATGVYAEGEDDDGNEASDRPLQEPKAKVAQGPTLIVKAPMANFGKFLSSMIEMKGLIGEANYYTILGRHGYTHANEIKTYSEQVDVFKEMEQKAKEKHG